MRKIYTLFAALICAIGTWATDYKQGKLPGAFSISSTQVVYFAQGNLQYTGSWRFADNQWDIYGDTQTDNHRDLFRWGSGTTPNMTCSESVTQFKEWGANAITNGGNTANMWRTLSKDEWKYLLAGRATPENLTAVGTVESVEGLILLPDDWTLPSGASLNVGAPNYSANVYNSAQWAVLEAAGAVFLPHAGMLHDGIYVRSFEEFSCFYWMSSGNPNEGDVLGSSPSISYWDNETGNNIDYAGPNMSLYGCYSVPVRLVSETPAPTASISSAPTAIIGLVYDGSAQALVNAGSSSTGTVYYSLDNSTWSTAIPTATNAGSYTVYYKVVGDANHSDYTPASNTVTVTINVASITTAGSVTTYYSTFASAVSAWEANSTLTLLADVITNSKVEVSNTRTIDLNGYGITMTGTDCIFLLQSGGNLTMIDTHPTRSTRRFNVSDHLAILADGGAYSFQGGYLTGGRGSTALDWYYRGGAVFLKGENCRFTMRGGMILGNRASFGGGVQIRRGRFVMEGGAIIYNRATERDSHGGGAIFVDCGSGQLTLGGTALIEHNYSNGYDNGQVFVSGCTDGALVISGGSPRVINSASTNNIIHNSAIMTITGALTADADLPLYVQPGVLTSGYDTYHHGVDPSTFFSIQNEGYIMRLNANGEVEAVTPSSVSVAPIAKTGLVYTGAAQELVTAGTANGGTMYYSLNNSTWSTDVPTGTDAGNYTVYYKVVGDANHSDYIPASNTIAVAIADFSGSGTEGDPYLIPSTAVWNHLKDQVNAGADYSGKYFRQTADISVTTMIGTSSHMFSGTYDGDGHTLNVTYNSSAQYAAPFSYANVVTFKNLRVAGTITTSAKYAAGFIGWSAGATTFLNCRSSITINSSVNGDGTHGGYIGILENPSTAHNITFVGCIFDGEMIGSNTTCWGGFVGWSQIGSIRIQLTDCLFAPSVMTVKNNSDSRTFSRGDPESKIFGSITNSYYVEPLGITQAKQAYSITAGAGITCAPAGTPTTYNVSGISSYGTGIKYNDVFYGGESDAISLTLSGSSTGYYASTSGTVSGSSNPYTLSMGAANAVINASSMMLTAPSAISELVYDGTAHALINAGTAEGGTMQYQLGNGAWSTDLPQATFPGYYIVSYKVVGDTGYEDYTPANNTLLVHIGIDPAMTGATIDAWTSTGMVVTTKTQNIGSTTATIYTDGTQRATDLALTSVDAGIWSVPASLNSYAGEKLLVAFYDGSTLVSVVDTIVPYVVSEDAVLGDLSVPMNADVQVVAGTLTVEADAAIGALDIYPDAKVVVTTGINLSVNSLTMRADGINNGYPQLVAKGNIFNANNDSIYYDYTVDYEQYYPLAVPYDVSCSAIRTRSGKPASFEIQWYNSEDRAANAHAWTVLDDQAPGATLHTGQGYIIYGVPYKWNGTRQQTTTIRFPMKANLSAGGEQEKTVPIYLYGNEGTNASNRNWNFIANPYLANYRQQNEGPLQPGSYNPETSTPDVESYTPVITPLRYVTTSYNGYRSYSQVRAKDIDLLPFHGYFVQAAEEGFLTCSIEHRAQHAPRRQKSENQAPEELALGIILSNADAEDRTGLLYGDAFTDAYELNADLVKLFGSAQGLSVYSLAGNEERAFNALARTETYLDVPIGFRNAPPGELTFAFDSEHYDASPFEAVLLTDNEQGITVNLLNEDYTFTTSKAQNDTRFVLYVAARSPQIATEIETTNGQSSITNGIYDLLGRPVTGEALPAGIYIIMENGQSRKEVRQ